MVKLLAACSMFPNSSAFRRRLITCRFMRVRLGCFSFPNRSTRQKSFSLSSIYSPSRSDIMDNHWHLTPYSTTHPGVDVFLSEHITKQLLKFDELWAFPAFNTWFNTLIKSLDNQSDTEHPFNKDPYFLRSIEIQSVDRFGGQRIGFIKLIASITNSNNEKLPGSILLRGGSVGIMILLQPEDVPEGSEENKYVLLAVQPRVPAGSMAMVELPAGMLDDAGSFAGAAAKEVQEECGLEIKADELIDMTQLAAQELAAVEGVPQNEERQESLQQAVYPSPGGCDEYIALMLHQRRMPRKQLLELNGKLTGLREYGEKITLRCIPLQDLWMYGCRDGKTLSALALYEGLKRRNKISEI